MFRRRYISNGYVAAAAGGLLALGACGEGPSQPEPGASATPSTSVTTPSTIVTTPSASVATTQAAETTSAQSTAAGTDAIDIINWDQAGLRGGYSANRLVGMDVHSNGGKSIGEVEDVIVDADGKATAIVVESGGFLDIGDKHFRIPWDSMRLAADLEHVVVPLDKKTAAMYRDTRDREKVRTGPREYRMSELRNDTVTLAGGERYGVVDDLIIGRDGKVSAVVVNATTGTGRYAYPFRSGAYNADTNAYALPYQQTQINNLKPFDYRAVAVAEPRMRATGAASSSPAEGAAGTDRRERQARPPRQSRG